MRLAAACLLALAALPAWAQPELSAEARACLADLEQAGQAGPEGGSRQDRRALFQAAKVLAQNGDERGCRLILDRIHEMGKSAAAQPRPPLAQPRPVSQQQGLVRSQNLVGAEIRNLDDRRLGEVADLVVDPRQGKVDYLLVSRGGFLGLGGQMVAVPFVRFQATADPQILVLDVPEDKLAQAPSLPESQLQQLSEQRPQIDVYWD